MTADRQFFILNENYHVPEIVGFTEAIHSSIWIDGPKVYKIRWLVVMKCHYELKTLEFICLYSHLKR